MIENIQPRGPDCRSIRCAVGPAEFQARIEEHQRVSKKNVDFIYLHPHHGDNIKAWKMYPLIPVGVVAIVNHLLDSGLTGRGLNVPLELRKDEEFDPRSWIEAHQFSIALIDINWYLHLAGGLDLAALVKEVRPGATVLVGGLTATRFSEEILTRFPAVDAVCRGDGEVPAQMLAEKCAGRAEHRMEEIPNISWRGDDGIRNNPQSYVDREMDRWNYCDLGFLESEQDYYYNSILKWADLSTHWLALGRGCRFACYHCDGSSQAQKKLFGRAGLMVRDPELVARDIETLAGRGIENVSFTHDLVHIGEDYWRALFAAVRSSGVKIGAMQPFWQSLPSEDFAREFSETFVMKNSYVNVSIETAVEEMRRHIHNCTFYTNEEFFEGLRVLKQHGVPIMVYFRLNAPWESARTMEVNIKCAAEVFRLFPDDVPPIFVSDVPLDPSSPYSHAAEGSPRFSFRFPELDFDDYLQFSRGMIPVEKVFAIPGGEAIEMRNYSEFEHLGKLDVLFVKKLVPRMWERWEELMLSDGKSWDAIRGGVVV